MKMHVVPIRLALCFLALAVGSSAAAFAHCDTLDGPVVTAARAALAAGDPKPVLIWVSAKDEAEVRAAFEKTLAVRKLGDAARDLADRYFFETVVRIHRAGEGEPYTGLKPAGIDLGPAIPAADQALQSGSVDPLVKLLTDAVGRGVREQFGVANARKQFDKQDVDAGRKYVAAYVAFMHYVERIYQATAVPAHEHGHAAEHAH